MALLPRQAALVAIIQAIHETIIEAGEMGAPAGPMYAALMAHWPSITTEQFYRLTDILVEAGVVRKANHVFYDTKNIARSA